MLGESAFVELRFALFEDELKDSDAGSVCTVAIVAMDAKELTTEILRFAQDDTFLCGCRKWFCVATRADSGQKTMDTKRNRA